MIISIGGIKTLGKFNIHSLKKRKTQQKRNGSELLTLIIYTDNIILVKMISP